MQHRFLSGTVTLLIVLAGFAMTPVHAQEPAAVTVNVFPGGFNWPSFVAQEKGFWERHGIRVTLQATPNSVAQMTGLAEGRFDIAMTAVDNIVAYVEGQGEAPIGPQPEFFAFLGSDNGFLNLVVAPTSGPLPACEARACRWMRVLRDMLSCYWRCSGETVCRRETITSRGWEERHNDGRRCDKGNSPARFCLHRSIFWRGNSASASSPRHPRRSGRIKAMLPRLGALGPKRTEAR